jgi:BirA family biotin operon repressor/biotin-[acetyl-CoA-carboxylase] ligase
MPWREVRIVERTGSTNADLLALAAQGEPSGLVLVAREQTQGRGRLDREWVSPPGSGLTFSALLRTALAVGEIGPIPLLAGAAVAEAVETCTGLTIGLKWPNDLIVRDRKLGGLLVQHSPTDALVIGIGLNVSLTVEQRPTPQSTSLLIEGVPDADREHEALLEEVLRILGAAMGPLVDARQTPGIDALTDYRARCTTLGRDVEVQLPSGQVLRGRAKDVDATGALIVDSIDGDEVIVTAGDVIRVR